MGAYAISKMMGTTAATSGGTSVADLSSGAATKKATSDLSSLPSGTALFSSNQSVIAKPANEAQYASNLINYYGQGQVLTTANPLEFRVLEVGGGSHLAAATGLSGTSAATKKAARQANAQSIAAIDPSYKNTISYQQLMSG